MTGYLELDRQFMPFQDEEAWEVRYQSFLSDNFYGCERWPDLLNHKRTVILAEAGAGKTAEMFQKAKALVDGGSAAFYMTVNNLAKVSFLDALVNKECQARFEAWLAGDKEGFFFVDSVDEARMLGQSFRDALLRLANAISGHATRATILVSCRVSDWGATLDRAVFEEVLGKPPDIQARRSPPPEGRDDSALLAPLFHDAARPNANEDQVAAPSYVPHVTALAPLTEQQSQCLAGWNGVADPGAFISAVRQADADSLVNRPQDLLSLSSLWSEKGKIGSKYTILKWSIQQRLRETNRDLFRRDTLSQELALAGAKRIAAAMTLCHKRFIAWPLDTPTGSSDSLSLDPSDVLPDWSGQLQQSLLNRAIFDPASHGRVRFHHRSVQELLCAEWLLDLVEDGCPFRHVWMLLTNSKYGSLRLRPSMRPVTAWLGQLDQRIRCRLMPIAPELLIEDGDPALLSTSVRELLLEQFASRYRDRDDAGISIGIDQIERLADPALAERIKVLWGRASGSGELRELLLRLIWAGRIEECGDVALAAATGRGDYYQRQLGSLSIAEIGTKEQRRALTNHLLRFARSYPKRALAAALEAVFPSIASLEDLEIIIRKSPRDNLRATHSGLGYGLSEIARHADLPNAVEFGCLLHRLVTEKPWVDTRHLCYSKRFAALVAPLVHLCSRIISDAGDAPLDSTMAEITKFAGSVTTRSSNYEMDQARKRLREAVFENPGVNRQQFWLAVETTRAEIGDLQSYGSAYGLGELWQITAKDVDWLVTDLETKVYPNDRHIALQAVFSAYENGGNSPLQLQAIRSAIDGDAVLENELDRMLNPPAVEKAEWQREYEKHLSEIEAGRKRKRRKIEKSWLQFRDRLVADPKRLKEGTAINDLFDLAQWMNYESENNHRYSRADWQVLSAPFSPEVARAARDGFVAYWRNFDQDVKSTRRSSTSSLEQVALIGLAIEAESIPDFAARFSDDDVARATSVALHEINGFPEWAPDFWVRHSSVAERIFREEIRWEFDHKPKQGTVHHVVSPLSHAKEPFRSHAAKWVLCEMEARPPSSDYTLSLAIDTITGAKANFSCQLAVLSAAQFSKEQSSARRLVWLSVWFGVAADGALEALQKWIDSLATQLERDTLIMRFLNTMFDHGVYQFGQAYHDFARFEALVQLLQIAYSHVRREDDREHEGSYSPDERDNAERARSALLGILLDIPGEEVFRALMAMSEMPDFALSSERFRTLADRRATADADLRPWDPSEIVAFAGSFEQSPATLAELHDVVLNRLWDIEDEMRAGRFSNKSALRQDHLKRADERVVQLGIADQLHLRSRSVYSIEREPELESRDAPDISIQRAGIDEPLPIEIKVADSWSYAELRAAILGQLIAKYMKPRGATHGHLVVSYHGKKSSWRPGAGKPELDFLGLVHALQTEADQFTYADPYTEKVSVTGIDLRDTTNK